MTEQECLERMVAPGTPRPGKYRQGVIQIHVTRACDLACFGCTQGSNLGGKTGFMSPEHFEQAVRSLGFGGPSPYFGVVGVFGGNPALSPHFPEYCHILRDLVPFEQRGLWCNHPRGNGPFMRVTFDPGVSNLNCHLSQEAFDEFKRDWPESRPFGHDRDCRHSPPFVAMWDVIADEGRRWELISGCDINQHWSAMVGVFRGQLRAWFCEVAGAQAMLHQAEPDYPDIGYDLRYVENCPVSGGNPWWKLPMTEFRGQVRKHCHECGVPLRGYGELAQAATGAEQTSRTHAGVYQPKRRDRPVQVVEELVQLESGRLRGRFTDYMGNAKSS